MAQAVSLAHPPKMPWREARILWLGNTARWMVAFDRRRGFARLLHTEAPRTPSGRRSRQILKRVTAPFIPLRLCTPLFPAQAVYSGENCADSELISAFSRVPSLLKGI